MRCSDSCKRNGTCQSLSNKCSDILEDILHHARELPGKDAPYKYSVSLDVSSWKAVADALDTYSRVLMGQFGVIYEALDISGNDEQHLQAYHDARWNGVGIIETRDLLIPQLKRLALAGTETLVFPIQDSLITANWHMRFSRQFDTRQRNEIAPF